MNGDHEGFAPRAARIQLLSDSLYRLAGAGNIVELNQILEQIRNEDPASIAQLLRKLDAMEIVDFDGMERIRLRVAGKTYYDEQCMAEVILGLNYSDEKYSSAVVRIVLRKPDGSAVSGTGFFVNDPPNHIVTNRHVVDGNTIVRIEDLNGRPVREGELPKVLGPEDLDIAAIECPIPRDLVPPRIDWTPNSVRPLDEVLVLGYPYVALHQPTLHHAKGKVGSRPRRLTGIGQEIRESLIISDVAAPGCSGGPVISIKGMVAGVIVGEVGVEGENMGRQIFVSAIPSHYLRELFQK